MEKLDGLLKENIYHKGNEAILIFVQSVVKN